MILMFLFLPTLDVGSDNHYVPISCYLFFENNMCYFILLEIIWTLITTPAYWQAVTRLWRNYHVGQLLTFGNPAYCSIQSTTLGGLFLLKPTTWCFVLFCFGLFLIAPQLVEYSVINTITSNKLMDIGINVKKYTCYSWWHCFFITSPATQKLFCCIV